jgi:hypothetical protein
MSAIPWRVQWSTMTQSGVVLTLSADRARLIDGQTSWGNSMKRSFVVLSMTLAAVGATPVWAQGPAASGAQATESTDSKVRVADRTRDHEVAKAWAERNKAVDAARSAGSSS